MTEAIEFLQTLIKVHNEHPVEFVTGTKRDVEFLVKKVVSMSDGKITPSLARKGVMVIVKESKHEL
jgi:ABC-type molybdate transport system ATPase subunit